MSSADTFNDKNKRPMVSGMTCKEMTTAMKRGDEAAWKTFHSEHYAWLIAVAIQRSNNPADASEFVQLTYLRAVRHIKVFSDATELRNWLLCLLRCVIIDHARKIKNRSVLLEKFHHWQQSKHSDLSQSSVSDEKSERIDTLMALLPPADSLMLQRKYIDGWSTQEIAADSATTPKAIESKLARLKKRIRHQFST